MFVGFKGLGDAFDGFEGNGSELGSECASGEPVGIALLRHECEGYITRCKIRWSTLISEGRTYHRIHHA